MNILGGMESLWIFSQNWTIFRGSFLCILESFLKVKVQNGGYLLGVIKISNILWGV